MCLLIFPSAGIAVAGTIGAINIAESGSDLTVKVDVAKGFKAASSFALANPSRIVVDVDGAAVGVRSATGQGGVKGIRAAQFTPEITRLVIDLDRPMTLADATASPAGGSLTLRLHPASPAEFALLAKAPRRHFGAAPSSPPSTSSPPPADKQPVADKKAAPQPRAVETAPIVENDDPPAPKGSVAARGKRPLVVIDAGHGGHDTGALSIWDGKREKDATLAIAREIKKELDKSGRVRAVLTRSDDRFLVLAERREVARRLKADLFISIHADSASNPDAHGATVYTLSEVSSDREAAKLAARENRSDIINGVDLGKEASDVSSILIDLARRDTMNVSSSFAALLQREMSPYVTFKSEYHRFAGFVVLKAPDTPSVLIETGYLSNMDDAHFLFSKAGQHAIAVGVKNAIEAHFARRYRVR